MWETRVNYRRCTEIIWVNALSRQITFLQLCKKDKRPFVVDNFWQNKQMLQTIINFNVLPIVGTEEKYIHDAILSHNKICADKK